MNLFEAIETVSKKFTYTADRTGSFMKDNWFIMKEQDGKYRGDCEDYALTVMYLVAGGYLKFFWKLITGEYKLHITSSNGDKLDHCVGSIDGVWFDDWTLKGLSREQSFEKTGQKYGHKRSVFVVFSKLLVGKLFGKK